MINTNQPRKQITDLSEPLQIRELNKQINWLYTQMLGRLSEETIGSLETRVKDLEDSLVYPKSPT